MSSVYECQCTFWVESKMLVMWNKVKKDISCLISSTLFPTSKKVVPTGPTRHAVDRGVQTTWFDLESN